MTTDCIVLLLERGFVSMPASVDTLFDSYVRVCKVEGGSERERERFIPRCHPPSVA